MNTRIQKRDFIHKITMIGILTALATALSLFKIPLFGATTITLVLPVVVIGAVLYGKWVGAWLTVIPNVMYILMGEWVLFLEYRPFISVVVAILKGVLAGFAAGLAYQLLSKKHPTLGTVIAAIAAPVVNTGIFLLGCYLFLWPVLLDLAAANSVGIGALILGLAILNFIAELILNIILCPAIIRIIDIAKKKRLA